MYKDFSIKILSLILLGSFVFGEGVLQATAQTGMTEAEVRRAKLEAELAGLEKEIDAQADILTKKQREGVSLERDITILNANIEKAKLSIRARSLTVEELTSDIGVKSRTIGTLSAKLEREREALSELIKKTNEIDSYSLPEVALSDKYISEFWSDLDSFIYIEEAISASLVLVSEVKVKTEEEKTALEEKKEEESNLRRVQELEKRRIEANEAEKKRILKETRGLEKEYQTVLKEKQKSAAAIRSELFSLSGSAAIPFEKALELAKFASQKTGVRPAVILGILREESNLGQNVGKGIWTVDMHPTRDRPIFVKLTAHLGLNPDNMPVSKKVWYGYGGAMGPSQFIPSTWVLYAGYEKATGYTYNEAKDRIGSLTGHRPPNPWDPKDAIMATALLMADNGADKGTRAAERLAALRYLAGWTNATKKSYAFYGDDVMRFADEYQKNIEILGGN
ncbi:MAG: lytic murein transglycosylase [Patescibacteria group bacterium]